MNVKQTIPAIIAVFFGLLTLVGILFDIAIISDFVLGWAGFVAAAALLLGVFNLFLVHLNRTFKNTNFYSGILVLSMLAVWGLAITDSSLLNLTNNGVETMFTWVQAPLEAALASLLAFFLLFAGFQMLKRQRTVWSLLFMASAIVILASNALMNSALLPAAALDLVAQIRGGMETIVVTAGMRGLIIGIALGTVTLSLRLLFGVERPYNK